MDYIAEYKSKLITAEEAAKLVKSGDWVQMGEFVMQPKDCDAALAKRKDELTDVKIRLTTMSWLPEVCKVDPERKHFIMNDWHFSGTSRRLMDKNLCSYIPLTYHEARSLYQDLDVDVSFQPVTSIDKNGFFNFSTSNSMASYSTKQAKKLVVEVNSSAPVCLGGLGESIHISEVDYIVESSTNSKLVSLPELPVSTVDQKIAALVMEEMMDGACIQLGIGAMPNTVGALIAQSDLKDLGVHTEMLCDSFVDMYEAGKITGAKKTLDKGKMVYTFAMGSDKLYNFLDYNPVCASYPVHYCNDPYIIAQNNNVVAINNALEVDLYGQVASEASAGRQISGTGGQLDFIIGAFHSQGGKPIIALSSSVKKSDGSLVSRIKPGLSPGTIVTVPRSITSYVITEYGSFNLKGKSTWERAEGLINIAHPAFRDELVKAAEDAKIWLRSNKLYA
ncbi:Acetyl-CoA hydrolase/transferase [Syntrophomonas zehnderi OL-4]|uniref:Probable butyrate:acetyl-CoA coenzyme A-transferase n=1 Tax=Syntrophomonas zehnderi OL-4 TaxID=690567 RepID=A0A0E4C9S8_9FIRM|nr:acetyl-CoA hydrolase/transferase C-terminal domain-containing protein [Syntrophomonas zehnderi]CFY10305.1 Acetyl-CoA hydrolase/transferase [Syntrophomonas zehnderi OL-4]